MPLLKPRHAQSEKPFDDNTQAGQAGVDSTYAWVRMFISVVLGTIGSVGMWAVVLVLPAVQAEFGIDRASASLPYTMTMIGYAVGNVLIGRIVDRFGITRPTIFAALMLGAGFILAAYTTAIWQLAVLQGLLIGIGTAATFGPLIADLSHWFNKRRGIAVAAAASGNYLAGAIWPNILEGYVATQGWRTTYLGIGIVCMVTMIPLALMLRRKLPKTEVVETKQSSVSRKIKTIDLSPRALQTMLALAGICCCVAMAMPQVHLVAYCGDLGFGLKRGAEMLSLMLVGGVLSRIASGFIADYIGGVRTLILGSVLQCLALTLYIPFDGLMSLYIVSFVFGLSQGGIVPSYAIIVREYLPAHEAGQRVGMVIMATLMGMALGGWMSGWIYDVTGSYRTAFLNGIAWNMVNIVIMLLVLWRTREPHDETPIPHPA